MVTKDNFIETTLKRLKKLDVGTCIVIKTFKKDRGLTIEKLAGDAVTIYEEGFENKVYEQVAYGDLKKLLKALGRIEFPRSHSLWLQVVDKRA